MRNRIFLFLLGVVVTISVISTPVYASEQNSELKDKIIEATTLLETLLQASYDETLQEVKEEIAIKEYDYTTTMESLSEVGNPFGEMDYSELIATYCVLIEHVPNAYLYDAPFLHVEYLENTYEEIIPVKTDKYVENEDGTYSKQGVYYITESGEYDTYEEISEGIYEKSGTTYVEVETTQVPFALVKLDAVTPEELFSYFDIEFSDIEEEYKKRLKSIRESGITNKGLRESIFIEMANPDVLDEESKLVIQTALSESNDNQYKLVDTASSLIGNVPYEWGGKSVKAGYDNSWWSFDEESGKQNGLDCSGYVQWIYRSAGYPYETWGKLGSTSMMLSNLENISYSELSIGDLGLLNNGETVNHVGMYLGDGYFIHCSSGSGTVTVDKQEDLDFKYFKTVADRDYAELTTADLQTEESQTSQPKMLSPEDITEETVYLLAQTISREAKGEGLNGWIAVGEVIVNRVNSELFPDTVSEVIFQESASGVEQFSGNEYIRNETPTQDIIDVAQKVLEGKLRIFNNENVLFYRNPGDRNNNSDWGKYPFYKRINQHVFYLYE